MITTERKSYVNLESHIDLVKGYFPDLTEKQLVQFEKLTNCFKDWNSKINLVSRKDIDEFTTRHLLHSLAIAKAMKFAPGSKVLDVGTGGGLPGLPLAILYPDVEFTLCDSIGKKIMVVNDLIKEVGIDNAKGYHLRAQQIPGKFDFIVSRAVTRMNKFLPWIEGKISKRCINPWPNGVLYLKGGDLTAELSEVNHATDVHPISEWFSEEFFETKSVVYVKLS